MASSLSSIRSLYRFFWPGCALGCSWWLLIHQLGAQWSVYDDYRYGWSVPVLCVYLIWLRINSRVQKGEENRGSVQRDSGGVTPSTPSQQLPVFVLAFSALLYAPTRFLHEANPIWRLTSLSWAIEVIGLTLCFVYLGGSRLWLQRLSFPICFFLVAVPWPSGLEAFLVQSLTRLNVGGTIELLGLFGVPALQHGNVIEIGTGTVGIDEACSGIRSFQATLMISLFLGEVFRLSLRRRLLLVSGGFLLAFVFNVGRTSLLVWIASGKGITAMSAWHDPAGVTILVANFLCLWLAVLALRKRSEAGGEMPIPEFDYSDPKANKTSASGRPIGTSDTLTSKKQDLPTDLGSRHASGITHGTLMGRIGFILVVWLVSVEAGTQIWYRAHERSASGNLNWSLQEATTNPDFKSIDIPEEVRAELLYDHGLEGVWQDSTGARWQLYYFRWLRAQSLNKRISVQLGKSHGPEVCLPAIGMTLQSDLGVIVIPLPDLSLAVHQYVFKVEGRLLHVFHGIYEDQSGSAVLTNRRLTFASRIAAAFDGSRNSGQRFLELAVRGYDDPEDARVALAHELEKLIRVEK